MIFYHLWLLIQKSLRYAWRQRTCTCCPRILFEFLVPVLCLLFLILFRWIHTSTSNSPTSSPIRIDSSRIQSNIPSINVFNYTLTKHCPSSIFPIEVNNRQLYQRLKQTCPKSSLIYIEKFSSYHGRFFLNKSSIQFRCRYDQMSWCENISSIDEKEDALKIQHPSSMLCSKLSTQESGQFFETFLNLQSMISSSFKTNKQLNVYTWPCLGYFSDPLFDKFSKFSLVILLIFLDGCILYSFDQLFHSLIDEKSQGITELLRLISIQPILNSLAWFLRYFFIQTIINIFIILILKSSFGGEIYFRYVSIWLVLPTIFLWTIQVFSRSVLIAHFFHRNLKATIWSWIIYILSFWLALSSSIRLPSILHYIASAWLKPIQILFDGQFCFFLVLICKIFQND